MNKPLLSYEIGSLAKPEWRVKVARNAPLSPSDLDSAKNWGERLGIDYQLLYELLQTHQSGNYDQALLQKIKEWSSLYVMRFFEQSGLDLIYDGEQQRSEMYHYPISKAEGFIFRGHVRSFDNKYYNKAACVGEPELTEPYHIKEFNFLKQQANSMLKVPITGAYTLADWSFDEYFAGKSLQLGTAKAQQQQQRARREFVLAIARNIVRPCLKALVDAGAQWFQIDEPAVTTRPDEVPLFVEAFNECVKGLSARFTIHICYSDYHKLFPHIDKLENCWGLCLGFANDDSQTLGVNDAARSGYHILKKFAALSQKFHIGVGVLDIHKDTIESVELIRDRLAYAINILGIDYVNPCPDCGLRTRSWEVSYQKLKNMAAAIEQLTSA